MASRHSRLCQGLAIAAAVATLAHAGAAAAAQYQWRDAQGRMVYSDLPPPATIAPDRIIKAPAPRSGVAAPLIQAPATAPPAAPPIAAAGPRAAVAVDASQTIADRELAYRKRTAEREEREKKALEESRRKFELAQACTDAKGDIRSLESGQRISRIDAAGERTFLSDGERAERLKAARKSVGERC